MKRSSFITWDQLKVGALILVALIILGVGILKLGDAGNLFGKRYRLVAYVASATGMRIGGPVTVAGQLAGSIKDIRFLPVDADTTRNLELVVEVNSALADSPALVNEDPSGKGWFVKIKLADAAELDSLMDENAYREFLTAVS